MALQLWLPLNGDLRNNGLSDIQPTSSNLSVDTNGKIGQCIKTSSTGPIDTGLSYDKWNFGSGSVSFGGWFKFNKNEINNALTAKTYTSASCTGTTNLLGYNSYAGFGLCIRSNNLYTGTSFTTLYAFASLRIGNSYYNTNEYVVPFDTWLHFMVTFDKGAKLIKFYVDGVKIREVATGDFTDADYAHQNFRINTGTVWGGNGPGVYMPFYTNDIRVYDHCLSEKEVLELSQGLAIHYKLDDGYLEASANINSYPEQGIDNTCYNGATGKYGYGSTTDMYKVTGYFEGKNCTKVYMGTNGLSAYPYVEFTPLHPANGEYKTLSFDYFPSALNAVRFYTHHGSATCQYSINGSPYQPYTDSANIPVNIGEWNHIILVLYGTSTQTSGWGYMQIGSGTHTSNTNNYWLFANVQIELNDHATAYHGTGKNLVTGLTAGGRTTVDNTAKTVTTNGENADTYFTINLSENIVSGNTYALTCTGENISQGQYWGFPLGNQNNTALNFMIYPGSNTYTFTANNIDWGTKRLFMDDNGRADYANHAVFKNWYLEKIEPSGLIDDSGFNNNGTFSGPISMTTGSPRYDMAMANQRKELYTYIETTANLSGPFTVSFWRKPTNSTTVDDSKTSIYYNGANLIFTYINYPYFPCGLGSGYNCYIYNNYWSDGKWHLFTCVSDTANLKMYIDGVMVKSGTTTTALAAGKALKVESRYESLSDFRVYTTALSDAAVENLYHVSASVDRNGALHTYELNEI